MRHLVRAAVLATALLLPVSAACGAEPEPPTPAPGFPGPASSIPGELAVPATADAGCDESLPIAVPLDGESAEEDALTDDVTMCTSPFGFGVQVTNDTEVPLVYSTAPSTGVRHTVDVVGVVPVEAQVFRSFGLGSALGQSVEPGVTVRSILDSPDDVSLHLDRSLIGAWRAYKLVADTVQEETTAQLDEALAARSKRWQATFTCAMAGADAVEFIQPGQDPSDLMVDALGLGSDVRDCGLQLRQVAAPGSPLDPDVLAARARSGGWASVTDRLTRLAGRIAQLR